MELASAYGTPLWVIDEEHFRNNCRAFRSAFNHGLFPDGVEVVYASKALLTLAVCRMVQEEGLSLDVVSGGELHAARAVGFPMDKVYFHGNNKTPAEIAYALETGLGRFMVDNLRELELIEKLAGPARRAAVVLRLKPNVDAGGHDYVKTALPDSKFGIDIENGQALEAVERCLASEHLDLRGLHCHIGSQILDVAPFARAAGVLLDFAAEAREKTGWTLSELSVGGGFGIRYVDGDAPLPPAAYAQAIARVISDKVAEHNLPAPRILVEPGRAISATAGWTLYTVGSVKDIPGVRSYVAVDGGMADNPRPALYHSRHEACLANRAAEAGANVVTIAGRCCESGDILIRDITLPEPQPGDILAVSCTGAYNYTMSMNYNRLPRPAMVLVNQGQVDVIVERETYDDLSARERIPERLGGVLPAATEGAGRGLAPSRATRLS